jgi:hypothetical protein
MPLPSLYDPAIPIESNRVYIADAKFLPKKTPYLSNSCFICCNGEPSWRHYNNTEYSLVVVDPQISLTQAFNKIQSIYSMYQDWEEGLQTLIGSTTLIQDLLNRSSIVLENLLCLSDEYNNLLASSSHGKCTEYASEYLDIFLGETGVKSLGTTRKQLADRNYTFGILQIQNKKGSPEVFFVKFFHGKIHVATLSMFPTEHHLQEHDKQLLEILAIFVQIQLLRPPQIESEASRGTLTSLLSGSPVRSEDITSLESALFIESYDQYRCIVLKLPAEVLSKSSTYLQRRIKVEVPASIAILYNGFLVGLINGTKSDWDADTFYQSMKHCLGKTSFSVGVSDSFIDLIDLHYYYIEAKSAIDYSESDSPHPMTLMDCWERYVLSNCTGVLRPELLFTPGFKRLLNYNRSVSVDYIETLKAYLEEGRNESKTASRLSICRNTFLYRLEKMKAVMDEDLGSPDVRFRLDLCLRLNDMIRQQLC